MATPGSLTGSPRMKNDVPITTYNDVAASGSSRMHNGNNYNYNNHYYGGDSRDADASPQPSQVKIAGKPPTENGLKLWRAAKAGQLPRVKYLLKVGVDLDCRCDEGATTSLHQAALNGHKDILDALLEAGASIDAEDNEGATALHLAGARNIAIALITAGADVDHEDHQGKTPGRRALDCQAMVVVEALIFHGHADRSKIYYVVEDAKDGDISTGGDEQANQASAITTSNSSLPPHSSANHDLTKCKPETKLITVIRLRADDSKASHAWADRLTCSDWHLRRPEALPSHVSSSDITLRPGHHLITVASPVLGFLLDSEIAVPVREAASVKSQRARLAAAQKSAQGAFADYVKAVFVYSSRRISSGTTARFVGEFQSETILIVPSCWSDGARATASRAIEDVGLRDVTLLKGSEAAMQYNLHELGDRQFDIGDTVMVCETERYDVYHTIEEVVSLHPLQLKTLRPTEVHCRDAYEDEIHSNPFAVFQSAAKKALAKSLHHERLRTADKQWLETEIRRAAALCSKRGFRELKLIYLHGEYTWTKRMKWWIENDHPDLEIFIPKSSRHGAFMHGLSKETEGHMGTAAAPGRPMAAQVHSLENMSVLW